MLEIMPGTLTSGVPWIPTKPGTRPCNQMPALRQLVRSTDNAFPIIPEFYVFGKDFIQLNFNALAGRNILSTFLLFYLGGFGFRN
jgi:hypothetical protein